MNLEEHIAAVEAVTGALLEALAADNPACATLLEALVQARGEALAGLGAALATVAAAERDRLTLRLRALTDADQILNAAAGTALAAAGEAARGGIGLSGRTTPVRDHQPQQACVDRRA